MFVYVRKLDGSRNRVELPMGATTSDLQEHLRQGLPEFHDVRLILGDRELAAGDAMEDNAEVTAVLTQSLNKALEALGEALRRYPLQIALGLLDNDAIAHSHPRAEAAVASIRASINLEEVAGSKAVPTDDATATLSEAPALDIPAAEVGGPKRSTERADDEQDVELDAAVQTTGVASAEEESDPRVHVVATSRLTKRYPAVFEQTVKRTKKRKKTAYRVCGAVMQSPRLRIQIRGASLRAISMVGSSATALDHAGAVAVTSEPPVAF